MKTVLKEQKEKMPISVVTSWIAKGWDEVGNITEMIKSIKESFTSTGKMEDYLQGIVDAYLICIGQMEKFLHDKDYVDAPESADPKAVKEALLTESGSIGNLDAAAWQKQVDGEIDKFGRVGAATYDDLDRDGLYLDADNKVQSKQQIVKPDVQLTTEDWLLDWTLNDTDNPAGSASGTVLIDTNPTAAEIEAAKREFGGGGPIATIAKPITATSEKHPIEDDFYIDFSDDFPAPTTGQLSDEEIEALQGVRPVD